jgi:OH-DDVA meta-cleavage compound hydrolase
MIIDIHAHFTAPDKLFAYKANLLASRARQRGKLKLSDDLIVEALNKEVHGGASHLQQLDEVGTDIQIISPRPYQMMHSEKPESIVRAFCEACNDLTARQVELFPNRFVGMASLPQNMGVSPANSIEELERCVKELGFVGCLLNSDPSENLEPPPGLGDEYWYPLYEKLVELDVPAMVHGAGCRAHRHNYTLNFIIEESVSIINILSSKVFEDFPKLKLIICHGGGAIPYQIGRFRAARIKGGRAKETFEESFRKLYFDTALYTKDALEMLFHWATPDRCMFGTERPGAGTAKDPATGEWMDDTRPLIESIAALSESDKKKIFEDNARKVFNLKI